MPRIGWFAVGLGGAALAATTVEIHPPGGPAVLGGTALGLVGLLVARRQPRPRPVGLVLLGIAVAVLRIAAEGPAPAPLLPAAGSWIGVVEELASPRDGRQRAVVRLETEGLQVLVDLPPEPRLGAGDVVRVDGRLRPPPDGPYGEYVRRSGWSGVATARRHERLGREAGPLSVLADARTVAADALARALPEPEAGLAAGILVGRRDRVDRSVAADFAAAGLSHIVAISGWNIAIVGAAVAAVAGRTSRRRRIGLTVGAIVAYVAFVGPSASVVRAAAMALVVLLARLTGRGARAASALAAAVVLLLVVDPSFAADTGFQLSVAATAGLLRWATPASELLFRWTGGRLPGWLTETLGVSLAAQLATLPIVVAAFDRISLVAPLANLVVVPCVPVAMALGAVALVGGLLGGVGIPVLATAAGLPAWLVLRLIVETAHGAAGLPMASLAVPEPLDHMAGLVAAVAVVGLARRGGRRNAAGQPSGRRSGSRAGPSQHRRVVAALLAIPVVAIVLGAAYRPAGDPTLVVFDVGQGDAILVEGGRGARLLVDGGPDPGRLLRLLDGRLPPWDRRIDVVVASHPHEDHVAGLPTLLARYRVGLVLTNGMRGPGPAATTLAQLLGGDRRARTLAAGDHLSLDTVELVTLWPPPGSVPAMAPDSGSAINDASIVLLGTVAGHRFLLPGDAEEGVDPLLLARGLPRLDVLKVAHHGSRTATTAALLEATRPSVAVVSVGAENPYGHPAPETLARLRAVGALVLRTDEAGSVEVVFRPRGIEVHWAGGVERLWIAASSGGPPLRWAPPEPAFGARAAVGAAALHRVRPATSAHPMTAVGYDPDDAAPRVGHPDDRSPPTFAATAGAVGGVPQPTPRSVARVGGHPDRGAPGRAGSPNVAAAPGPQRGGRARQRGASGVGRGPPQRGGPDRGEDRPCSAAARRSPEAGLMGERAPRAPLGFFTGDDEYALEEAVAAFARRVAGEGSPLARWRTSGREVGLETVVARLGSAPLFGGGTLVVVSEPDRLVAERSAVRRAAGIERLLDSVAPGNALALLDLPEPGKKPSAALAALRAGVEARGGETTVVKSPRAEGMADWIRQRARERGINLEPAAAAELAARIGAFVTEGDVDRRGMARLASSELDKLGHYRGAEPVRVEDVRALVAEAVPASSWAALDAVAERRVRGSPTRPGALALLDRLVEATPPPVLLAQLHRRLRELVEIRSALDAGTPATALARQRKLNPYRAKHLADQAARWTLPELEAALDGLLALDLRFKNVPPATEHQQRLAVTLWLLEHVAPRTARAATGRPAATGAGAGPSLMGSAISAAEGRARAVARGRGAGA